MTTLRLPLRLRSRFRGQNFAAFLLLFFLIIMFFAIVGDFSRAMAGMIKARDLADQVAMAAAGSVDAYQFNNGTVRINPALAELRAQTVVASWMALRYPEERFIQLSLTQLTVDDHRATATVSGNVEAVFGKFIGFDHYSFSRTATAELLIGIGE